MKKYRIPLLIATTTTLLPFAAMAGKGITSPYVEKGKYTVSTDGYFTFDDDDNRDGKFRERFTLDGGVTDNLGFRIRTTFDKPSDGITEYSMLELGGKYMFAQKNEWPIDVALSSNVRLRADHGAPTDIDTRLILSKNIGNWSNTVNLRAIQQVGENGTGGPEAQFLHQLTYKINDSFKVGTEFYGEFGELSKIDESNGKKNYFGPILHFTCPTTHVKSEVGYLFGMTEAAEDAMITWKISYTF